MHNQRVYCVCICKNEDRVIRASIEAWLPFAEKIFVQDTGSIDGTMDVLAEIVSEGSGKIMVGHDPIDVGASMVVRQKLIDQIPRDDGAWMLTLDSDEVMPESQIRALIERMSDPEIDFIAVRPVSLGQDLVSMYAPYYFEPENLDDRKRYTTEHFCDKWTTRAYRASRGIKVTNARWGSEVYSCEIDPFCDTITPDFKEEDVPAHHASTMFLGRTAWTDIHFLHLTNFTRSTKWREIPQVYGSNAMDRARWRTRGRVGFYPFPRFDDIPEPVRLLAESEGSV